MSEANVIKLKNVIASYPHVYEPRKGKNPRYESNFLLDESNAEHAKTIAAIKQEAARVAKEKFGDKVDLKKLKLAWGNNPEDAKYGAGMWFIQAWNKEPPIVVNRGRELTKSSKDPEAVYAGALVNTSVTAFAWEYKEEESGMTKRGVSFNLRPIQFVAGVKEGYPAFSQRAEVDIDQEFEALGDAANKASGNTTGEVDPFA